MEKGLRILQIITFALVMGVVTFAAVTFFVDLGEQEGVDANLFGIAIPILAISNIAVYVIVRRTQMHRLAERIRAGRFDSSEMPQEILSLTILGAALAESVALVGILAAWLTSQPVFLVASGVAVLLMILQIPTRTKILCIFERISEE